MLTEAWPKRLDVSSRPASLAKLAGRGMAMAEPVERDDTKTVPGETLEPLEDRLGMKGIPSS